MPFYPSLRSFATNSARFFLFALACLPLGGQVAAAADLPGDAPPAGYHLVAEDNCGTPSQTRVVAGACWFYPLGSVDASLTHRTAVFDKEACALRYLNAKPAAEYAVEVIYVDNAGDKGVREQRLTANDHEVHGKMKLPSGQPRRFVFPIPKAAYANGEPIDLKFIREAGENAVVSTVRVWSTDKTPLAAPAEAERIAYARPGNLHPEQLWKTDDPIHIEWMRREPMTRQMAGNFLEDDAAATKRCLVPVVEKHLRRAFDIAHDMRLLGVDVSSQMEALTDAAKRLEAMGTSTTPLESGKSLYLDVREIARALAFSHPRLQRNDGLLLVRSHHPTWSHQCARRRARYLEPGGDVCVISDIKPDLSTPIKSLTADKLPAGVFSRPDVSFDGRRIVFGYARADVKDMEEPPCLTSGGHSSVGNGTFFQVWEMPVDGSAAPRQVTKGTTRRQESTDPIYLAGERIGFMSPQAGGMVMCGDWAWADCMFSVNADGSDLQQVTKAKEGEWDPSLLDDGSIMFTRWEYVMRFWRPTQLIWNVRSDGSNPRVIGGYLIGERNYARCRQIPGTTKVACVDAHHHNDGTGNILVVDLAVGRDTKRGEEVFLTGAADCPLPLDENYFLVSYDPNGRTRPDRGGRLRWDGGRLDLYLIDAYGGLELIYRDPDGLSALYPMLLAPRPKPHVVPERSVDKSTTHGEMVIQDVHRGLPESMQDKARYIRVSEVHERHIHTSPCNLWVGLGGFSTQTVLGRVPVEEDGSAYFRVPAGKAVLLSVLDEDGLALHTMRMTTEVKPGESVGCVGCHEPMTSAPPVEKVARAFTRPASTLDAPPWGNESIGFPKHIQPILEGHCVKCHDGTKGEDKSFDLRAGSDVAERYIPGVWTASGSGYRTHYPYQSYWALRPHIKYANMHTYDTPPGSWGSRVSPLMQLLSKGHKDVKLSPAEWRLLTAWIDGNIPYLDDYRKFAVDPEIRASAGSK